MDSEKLLKRIKSLEDALGLYYVAPDTKEDYPTHVSADYGVVRNVENIMNERRKLAKCSGGKC